MTTAPQTLKAWFSGGAGNNQKTTQKANTANTPPRHPSHDAEETAKNSTTATTTTKSAAPSQHVVVDQPPHRYSHDPYRSAGLVAMPTTTSDDDVQHHHHGAYVTPHRRPVAEEEQPVVFRYGPHHHHHHHHHVNPFTAPPQQQQQQRHHAAHQHHYHFTAPQQNPVATGILPTPTNAAMVATRGQQHRGTVAPQPAVLQHPHHQNPNRMTTTMNHPYHPPQIGQVFSMFPDLHLWQTLNIAPHDVAPMCNLDNCYPTVHTRAQQLLLCHRPTGRVYRYVWLKFDAESQVSLHQTVASTVPGPHRTSSAERPPTGKIGGINCSVADAGRCLMNLIYFLTGVVVRHIDVWSRNRGLATIWLNDDAVKNGEDGLCAAEAELVHIAAVLHRYVWMPPASEGGFYIAVDDASRDFLCGVLLQRLRVDTSRRAFPRHLLTVDAWTEGQQHNNNSGGTPINSSPTATTAATTSSSSSASTTSTETRPPSRGTGGNDDDDDANLPAAPKTSEQKHQQQQNATLPHTQTERGATSNNDQKKKATSTNKKEKKKKTNSKTNPPIATSATAAVLQALKEIDAKARRRHNKDGVSSCSTYRASGSDDIRAVEAASKLIAESHQRQATGGEDAQQQQHREADVNKDKKTAPVEDDLKKKKDCVPEASSSSSSSSSQEGGERRTKRRRKEAN